MSEVLDMKNLIKLEEFALFIFAIYLFTLLDFSWWMFPLLLLTPDLGALGYLAGPRVGAATYNLTHHKGLSILFYLVGVLHPSQVLQLVGVIMLAHSSIDRVFGYGLKYPDSSDHTHLGWIGKSKKARREEIPTEIS